MKSQVLHTEWCNIPGEAAGETWHWWLANSQLNGVSGSPSNVTLRKRQWPYCEYCCANESGQYEPANYPFRPIRSCEWWIHCCGWVSRSMKCLSMLSCTVNIKGNAVSSCLIHALVHKTHLLVKPRSFVQVIKSDQVQISPAASPIIIHHTVWRTRLFIAYSDWKMIIVPILTSSLIHFSCTCWAWGVKGLILTTTSTQVTWALFIWEKNEKIHYVRLFPVSQTRGPVLSRLPGATCFHVNAR